MGSTHLYWHKTRHPLYLDFGSSKALSLEQQFNWIIAPPPTSPPLTLHLSFRQTLLLLSNWLNQGVVFQFLMTLTMSKIFQHLGRSLGGGRRDSFGPFPFSTRNAIFSPHVVWTSKWQWKNHTPAFHPYRISLAFRTEISNKCFFFNPIRRSSKVLC